MSNVHDLYDCKLNPAICKGRMVELGHTYHTLAERVAALSRHSVSFAYIGHIIHNRRRARHLWPYLAEALDAPLEYLTSSQPRHFSPLED